MIEWDGDVEYENDQYCVCEVPEPVDDEPWVPLKCGKCERLI